MAPVAINRTPPRTKRNEPSILSDWQNLWRKVRDFTETWSNNNQLWLPSEVIQSFFLSPEKLAAVRALADQVYVKQGNDSTTVHFRAYLENPLNGERFVAGVDSYSPRAVWRSPASSSTLLLHTDTLPAEHQQKVTDYFQYRLGAALFRTTARHVLEECRTHEQACYLMPCVAMGIDAAALRTTAGDIDIKRRPPSMPNIAAHWAKAIKACNEFAATQIMLDEAMRGFQSMRGDSMQFHISNSETIYLMMHPDDGPDKAIAVNMRIGEWGKRTCPTPAMQPT